MKGKGDEDDKKTNRNLDFKKANSPDYDGKDWTPDDALKDGPLAEDKRNCTDILFFCGFILFNIVWVYIAIWSIAK